MTLQIFLFSKNIEYSEQPWQYVLGKKYYLNFWKFRKILNQSLSFKTSVNSILLGKINAWFAFVISGQGYFSPQAKYIKSNHWRCFVKKVFLKSRKFHMKTVLESLFNKFPGPYPWSFIKKRLQHIFRTYANDCFYSRSSSSYYSRGPLKVHNTACSFIKRIW